tara:strand:- start:282 stop:479 length:198 start_codon:yes stop_codon:yes gene_type:complete
MKTRRIDIFLMQKFNDYCDEQLHYNTIAEQKDFAEYVEANKSFLIKLYVKQRRWARWHGGRTWRD